MTTVLPRITAPGAASPLLDALTLPVWVYDPTATAILWANAPALELWQATTLADLQARDLSTQLSRPARDRLQGLIDRLGEGGTVSEQWTLYPHGKPVTRLCTLQAVLWADGDSTDAFRDEAARQSERRVLLIQAHELTALDGGATTAQALRSIETLRHAPNPLAVYDLDGEPLVTNPAAEQHFGTRQNLWGLFPEASEREAVEASLRQGEMFDGEVALIAGGEPCWYALRLARVPDPVTGAAALLLSAHDISRQRLAERERKRSEADYRELVENAPLLIHRYGPDTTEQLINKPLADFIGVSVDQQLGRRWIDDVPEEQREALDAHFARLRPDKPSEVYVHQSRRADGALRWLRWTTQAFFDETGRLTHYQGVGEDITKERLIQETLERARADAVAASQAKSNFLAVVSHEIRTPLNAILGMSDLLGDEDDESERQRYLGLIRYSGQHLLSLINDILDFSKLEAGRLEVEHAPFDLRREVQGAFDLSAPDAQAKGLSTHVSVDAALASGYWGDPARLRQALLNLLANAVKFTEAGTVSLSVICERAEGRHDWLLFTIRDTGIGIPESQQKSLFTAFSQGDASTTRRYAGTGLGLAISRQLAEKMGGSLSLHSIEGEGSSFYLRLPLERAEAAALEPGPLADREPAAREPAGPEPTAPDPAAPDPADHEPAAREPVRASPRQAGPMPAHRAQTPGPMAADSRPGRALLVVEDDPINQLTLRAMLEREGHRVRTAASGRAALDILEETLGFDLILMDIRMPEMDGLTATREIMTRWSHDERPPIVGLTAESDPTRAQHFLEAGMVDCLVKPVTRDQVHEAIERHLAAPSRRAS